MYKYLLFVLLGLAISELCVAEGANDSVRRHFGIDEKTELNEQVVRAAVLRIVSIGTNVNEVAKRLSGRGLSHPNWPKNPEGNPICFPDRTPIVCQFRSPQEERYKNEANWSVEFFFDNNDRLEEVEIRRWTHRQKQKK